MLTGGLGVTLLLTPMQVRIPKQGGLAMLASVLLLAVLLGNDGTVSRAEGALLVAAAGGLMTWLYRTAPVFMARGEHDGPELRSDPARRCSGSWRWGWR